MREIDMATTVGGKGSHEAAGWRVGIDLAAIDQVAESIDRFGDRYLSRIYTDDERADCGTQGHETTAAASLAARFAAKEAVTKVLRPPAAHPGWRSIEVRRSSRGWCEIHLHGAAARLADAQGLGPWSVSLTHEGNMAAAVVAAGVAADAIPTSEELMAASS